MTRQAQEQAIAKDLELCDMIMALGTKSAKAKARKHRKACFAQIKAWNVENGLDGLSDDELLKELLA
jgi:hypothetical protein